MGTEILPLIKYTFEDVTNTGTYTNSKLLGSYVSTGGKDSVNNNGLDSMRFNGSQSQGLIITDLPTLTTTTGLSVSIWARHLYFPPLGTGTGWQRLFEFGSTEHTELGVLYDNRPTVYTNANANRIILDIYNGTYVYAKQPIDYAVLEDMTLNLNDNIWHHYCLTVSPVSPYSTRFKLYIDNSLVVDQTLAGSIDVSKITNISIGRSNFAVDNNAENQQQMYINNFELYYTVLSAQQVSNIYTPIANSKLSAIRKFNYWGLLLYYPFEKDILNYATGTGVLETNRVPGDPLSNIIHTGQLTTTTSKYTSAGAKSYLTNDNGYFRSIPIMYLNKSGFTVACWTKFNQLPSISTAQRIFDIGVAGKTGFPYYVTLWLTTNNRISVTTTNADTNRQYYGGVPFETYGETFIPDLNWHHYCVSCFANGMLVVYIDGLLVYKYKDAPSLDFYTFHNKLYAYLGAKTDEINANRSNANYNSFMLFNRGISPSEIGLLMGVKNTVLNGYFNSYLLPNVNPANYATPSSYYTLYNNNAVNYLQLNGWYSSSYSAIANQTSLFVITKASNWISNTSTIYNLLNDQQYWLGSQLFTSNTVTYTQNVYLEAKTYVFKYTAFGRPTYYDNSLTLTSSILSKSGFALANSITPTLSTTSFYNHNQIFTVTNPDVYVITFLLNSTSTNDKTIFLSGVQIIELNATQFLNKSLQIDLSMCAVDIHSGKQELTTYPLNSFINKYMFNDSNLFAGKQLYMHGDRSLLTGFKMNDIDLGGYFQQTPSLDGVNGYGYCFTTNYVANVFNNFYTAYYTVSNYPYLVNSLAQNIWAENTSNTQIAGYWLYYTFYYSGSNTTGTIYALVDDSATIYLNGTLITSNVGGIYLAPPRTYAYSFNNLNTGLNYIRVAVNNGGGYGTFVGAVYDSASTLLAITNQQWTWSNIRAPYNSSSGYNDIRGWLPYVDMPNEGPSVNLKLSGTTYYLAGTNVNTISSPSVPVNTNVSSNPPVSVTYNANLTTVGPITSLTGITPTFPSGYYLGTVSGTAYIYPYLDFTYTLETGITVAIPIWCKKIQYVIQNPGTPFSYSSTYQYSTPFYPYVTNQADLPRIGSKYGDATIIGHRQDTVTYVDDGARYDVFVYRLQKRFRSVINGTGGSCVYGTYNNYSSSASAITVMNTDSSRYIQFNDVGYNSNTGYGSPLLTNIVKNGSGTNPGSTQGITIPEGASNIPSNYGAGGISGQVNAGQQFIRIWFLT